MFDLLFFQATWTYRKFVIKHFVIGQNDKMVYAQSVTFNDLANGGTSHSEPLIMPPVKKPSEHPLPAAPALNELPAAFAFTLCSTVAIVMLPLRDVWESNSGIALLGAVLILLALLTWKVQNLRFATTTAMVVLTWQATMAVEPQHLPASFRNLEPQQVNSVSYATKLLILRLGMTTPAALMTLVLCCSLPACHRELVKLLKFGDWRRGISWPLPWWGVKPMPIWVYLLIGIPFAFPAFLPVINWEASGERWQQLSVATILMLPVLAFVNATLEELIFRVGMLPLLSQSVSLATATIPAAAIFGFVHFHGGFPNGWFGSLLLAYGGFMLGYLVIAQKGFSAAVVWHMLMDMIILCFTFR
ncbi:MAG: hypothetical protein CBD74_06580 [Saprospirales bacterium TMED214]|nr:MAG: hypothetical protein CBD74_06580 [Saprospirales bacterium TMED214]